MNDLLTAIPSVGFPIVVAWYLLTRSEREIKELREAVDKNTSATNALIEEIRKILRKK